MHAGLEFEEIPQLEAPIAHSNPEIILGAFPPFTIPSVLKDEVLEVDGLVDTRSEWRAALQTNIDSGFAIEYNISDIPQRPVAPRLQRSVRELDEIPTLIAQKAKRTSRKVSWAPME